VCLNEAFSLVTTWVVVVVVVGGDNRDA